MWESAKRLRVTREQREVLNWLVRNGHMPQRMALRVRIVLCAADGQANHRIAEGLKTSRATVLRWRHRFEAQGVQGLLHDAPRPGRRKRITRDKEQAIVHATLCSRPTAAAKWTVRALARVQGVSAATLYRMWRKYGLHP